MSSAITLFPAHSKDSNTLSEPLKVFIDEQLNQQVWYGVYLKDKKWGYGFHIFEKDIKHNHLIETLKMFLNDEEEGKKYTTITTYKTYFNLATGALVKCSEEDNESVANVESIYRADVANDFITVQSPAGTKTQLAWNGNFNLENHLKINMWIRSKPKIGSRMDQVYSLDCATGKVEQSENKLTEIRQRLMGGKKVKTYEVLSKDETFGESRITFLSDGFELGFSLGQFKMLNEPEAVAKSNIGFINITNMTDVKIREPIKDYEKISSLKLKISSLSGIDLKNSFQQMVEKNEDGSYSISLGPETQYREKFDRAVYYKKTQETAKYPVKSPVIAALIKEILDGAKTDNEKVWRLLAFVSNTLIDDYLANSEDALEILNRHKGDCSEHAILFTTLARAAGIPAREASGLIYNNIEDAPGFGGHAWVEVELDGEWIAVDPIWRERIIKPIRIKLMALDYMKIDKIEILETIYNYEAPDDARKAADGAYDEKTYEKSLSLYRPLAEKGDAYAQYSVGWAFEHGEGVAQDYKKAYQWYRKAALQGQNSAEYRIGRLYSNEKKLGNDPILASFWFERSAMSGNDLAAYSLAEAYETGAGMPKSKDMAFKWYKSAASSVFD
jgi:hypothetical protein